VRNGGPAKAEPGISTAAQSVAVRALQRKPADFATISPPNDKYVRKGFYENTFAPVNKAIQAKDMKAFETAYNGMIANCNGCHAGMGYGFIKVMKLGAPADNGIDYKVKSEPGDVPK